MEVGNSGNTASSHRRKKLNNGKNESQNRKAEEAFNAFKKSIKSIGFESKKEYQSCLKEVTGEKEPNHDNLSEKAKEIDISLNQFHAEAFNACQTGLPKDSFELNTWADQIVDSYQDEIWDIDPKNLTG